MVSTRFTILAAIVFSLSWPGQAALYPTIPTQETVIEAGKDTVIKWKNNAESPHLRDLGSLNLDLFFGDDEHHVTMLASELDAEDRVALINVDPNVGVDGSNYYIRFTPMHSTPIYTASFSIVGMTGSAPQGWNATLPPHKSDSAPQDAQVYDESTDTGPENSDKGQPEDPSSDNAESTARSTSSDTVTRPTSSMLSSYEPSRTIPIGPTVISTPMTRPTDTNTAVNSGAARYRRSRDSAGISKAGLIYLVWPLLMGTLLAI